MITKEKHKQETYNYTIKCHDGLRLMLNEWFLFIYMLHELKNQNVT